MANMETNDAPMRVYGSDPSGSVIEMPPSGSYETPSGIQHPGWRYALHRRWGLDSPLVFLMLNPSTADATADDPTIRRCVMFAQRERAGGVLVVNLFAWRATDPDQLVAAETDGEDAVGRRNDEALRSAMVVGRGPMVVAWGSPRRAALRRLVDWRLDQVRQVLGDTETQSLGVAGDGWPRHPLFVKRDVALGVWSW